jgi:hypothetical protein
MEKFKTDFENYSNELTSLAAIFGNFKQLSNTTDLSKIPTLSNINNESYDKSRSLLMLAETEDFVEFMDGKPALLVNYTILVVVGSSKNITDFIGSAAMNGSNINFEECNFYSDYLICHPLEISQQICDNNDCHQPFNIANNKYWCTKCHGIFTNASSLFNIIRKSIKFSEMPQNSILQIFKTSVHIDYNNKNDLLKVSNFLIADKRKIDSIQARINGADAKIKKIVEMIQTEKKFNEEKIKYLLSTRGGSMDEYVNTINEINQKIINV